MEDIDLIGISNLVNCKNNALLHLNKFLILTGTDIRRYYKNNPLIIAY